MNDIYIIGKCVRFILSEKSLERITDQSKVKLRAPASFCLQLLLENQGKLVTHDELYLAGWKHFGMSVSLNVLHNTIYYLRKVLHETGGFDNTVIKTINRRGFIFNLRVSIDSIVFTPDDQDLGMNAHDNKKHHNVFSRGLVSDTVSKNKSDDMVNKAIINLLGENENHVINNVKCHEIIKCKVRSSYSTFLVALIRKIALKITMPDILRKIYKRLIAVAIIFIFFLLSALSLTKLMFNDPLPSSYIFTGKLERCDVYQNNISYDLKNLKALDYLKGYCREHRSLYLTYYPYINKLSALNCKKKISLLSDDICFSNLFTFKTDELNNE